MLSVGNVTAGPLNNVVIINGSLNGYKPFTPVLYVATAAFQSHDLPDTIVADKNGKFTIRLNIVKPHIFLIYCEQANGFFVSPAILVKPGESHSIQCELTKDSEDMNSCVITGPNCQGQKLLTSPDMRLRGSKAFKNNLNLRNPSTIWDSINVKIARAELPYQKLFENKLIDSDFLDYSERVIGYYFACQFETVIREILLLENNHPYKEQFERISGEIFRAFPITNDDIITLPVFSDYIELYTDYTLKSNSNEFEKYAARGLERTYVLGILKKILTRESYKYYALGYLFSISSGSGREILDLFEQYKSEYPDYKKSQNYKQLESENIPAMKELYSYEHKPFPAGVIFPDSMKPINSFSDLTSRFAGKPIFIDCWATWCPGCILQFKYNKPLKEFLSQNGIEMVYIAFEKDDDKIKWGNYIKKYNLTGFHIRLTEELKNSLYETVNTNNSAFSLPRYIVVGKKGEIVEGNAMYPGKKEKLYEQIKLKFRESF